MAAVSKRGLTARGSKRGLTARESRRGLAAGVSGRTVLVTVPIALLLVAVAAVATVYGLRYRDARAVEDSRNASLAAAKGYATTMFGYKPDDIDAHIGQTKSIVAGPARSQYDDIITQSDLAAQVKKQQVVSDVSIQEAGVVTNTADTAQVLIFMNQSVTRQGNQLVQVEPSRLQYSMRKSGGRWTIENIDVYNDDSVRKELAPSKGAG
ncbi:hypothetical protein [Williamsia sterculiae]|uniref:Mce-associated membrane protein n=1 Tax=Williamsia sterculiae TaxID=1344003 RepID=A0A1N7CSK3_9NOCA|nr:hypothetical protein [Williamsia sterculiae]SIR66636.1 Mce-associated membrane protein [Williamsia sterculiae]